MIYVSISDAKYYVLKLRLLLYLLFKSRQWTLELEQKNYGRKKKLRQENMEEYYNEEQYRFDSLLFEDQSRNNAQK